MAPVRMPSWVPLILRANIRENGAFQQISFQGTMQLWHSTYLLFILFIIPQSAKIAFSLPHSKTLHLKTRIKGVCSQVGCWEERVKTRRFGKEGIIFAQSDLAAGNAENVRVGKSAHLLCLVLFILCWFWEVEFLCRDNTLTDMLKPSAGSRKYSLVINCMCAKPFDMWGRQWVSCHSVLGWTEPNGALLLCVSFH